MIQSDTPCPEGIPEHLFDGLKRYALEHMEVGGFLTAVLSNDLVDTIGHADAESMASLRPLMHLVYCELPSKCWGSREEVRKWLEKEVT